MHWSKPISYNFYHVPQNNIVTNANFTLCCAGENYVANAILAFSYLVNWLVMALKFEKKKGINLCILNSTELKMELHGNIQ